MTDIDLDRLIAELPELAPPPELDHDILAMIAQTPQDLAELEPTLSGAVSGVAEPVPTPEPANRPSRWLLLVGPLVAIAAAVLVTVMVVPMDGGVGDPDNFTFRGDEGAGPGLDLSMAVRNADGATERFERGEAYVEGDTLLFRVDAHAGGVVSLVRIDDDGAELIHSQDFIGAGTADLEMEGGRVGYALETGEGEAVFAVIRTEAPLSGDTIAEALAVGADVEAVCAAAWALGGRCAAERVEAVR